MPRYIIVYIGGNPPSSPEEGKKHFAKYQQWLTSLGSGSVTAMSGYTIIEVESMDEALEIAKACPFLETGGSLEVSELMQMPGMG